MTRPARPSAGWRMRVPPALLLLISSGLLLGWLRAWGADQGAERAAPWWIYLFLVLMSVAMVSLAAASRSTRGRSCSAAPWPVRPWPGP